MSLSLSSLLPLRCFTLLDKPTVEGKEIELKIDLLYL